MNVTKKILKKLSSDLEFRLKVAIALKVGERQVMNLIDKNSDNLTKAAALKVYESYGFSESEYLEPQKETV